MKLFALSIITICCASICNYQCVDTCTLPSKQQCMVNCGCSISQPQFSCLQECKLLCKNTNGMVTTQCLAECPCQCDQSCMQICKSYSLGIKCMEECGCIQQLDTSYLEMVAIATNKEIIAPNITMNFTTQNQSAPYSIIKSEITECAINFTAQNDKIAECLTKISIKQHSLSLLGCTIQCSITTWKNTELFLTCIDTCMLETLQPEKASNATMLIDPIIHLSLSQKVIKLILSFSFIAIVLLITWAMLDSSVGRRISNRIKQWQYGKKFDYYYKLE